MSAIFKSPALLGVCDLRVEIAGSASPFRVVDNVSLTIPAGKVVALVGESGCGKSLTALSILRLLPKPSVSITGGQILFYKGTKDSTIDLLQLSEREIRAVRGRQIAMIFQEPMTALNPVFSVGEQIAEVLILHQKMSKKEAWIAAAALLDQVGITGAKDRVKDYPHQLSGGMRQRVLIAMALACGPQLLIADEPTTALDVTVQAQILDLLREIQAATRMSILLITHDLAVVAQFADYVYVMYAGRVVEHAPASRLLTHPLHPYTQGLLRCTPRLDDCGPLTPIRGTVPDPAAFPPGCRFHPRCELSRVGAASGARQTVDLPEDEKVLRRCVEKFEAEPSGVPALREASPGHFVACWEVETVKT